MSLLFFVSLFVQFFSLVLTRNVTYDSRSLLLDGERLFILSGSIHYQRHLPSDWKSVLSLAYEAGLNTIQTYVFYNLHEVEKGNVDFTGQNNLTLFIQTAQQMGLYVVLRIGPYACGEHFGGGLPVWMLNSSGSNASCYRCTDPVWLAYSNRVLTLIVNEISSSNLLYPQGGNIIALQVENEYNGNSIPYLTAVVDQGRALTTAVPWILCHDLPDCTLINQIEDKAICTINGFWEDNSSEGVSQPSPAWVKGQVTNNPKQPLAWTEDQGWFDQWGVGQRIRLTSDILYGVSRAIAYGLSWHNFYMFAGGNNFAYQAAEGVTTAYANDVAIDSYLLRHEPKFSIVTAFHNAISSISVELLNYNPSSPVSIGSNCELATYGTISFISNLGFTSNTTEIIKINGSSYLIPNHTVVILQNGKLIFNTSAASDSNTSLSSTLPIVSSSSTAAASSAASSPLIWYTQTETVGIKSSNKSLSAAIGQAPFEMLNLTRNAVDYMWYSLSNLSIIASTLKITTCGGEYVYVYSNSNKESLKRLVLNDHIGHIGHIGIHTFEMIPTITNGIDILISGMGVNTSPSPSTCKGIKHVFADTIDLTNKGFISSWIFNGEANKIYTPEGSASTNWLPIKNSTGGDLPISWFKSTFDLPTRLSSSLSSTSSTRLSSSSSSSSSTTTTTTSSTSFALDLLGATKGVFWINGINLGRYNLELGVCNGNCAPPLHGNRCYIYYRNCNEPTQRYYYIPQSLLLPTGNLLVLFEETSTVPVSGQGPVAPSPPPLPHSKQTISNSIGRNLSTVQLVVLSNHP
jgi:hypothetical protein